MKKFFLVIFLLFLVTVFFLKNKKKNSSSKTNPLALGDIVYSKSIGGVNIRAGQGLPASLLATKKGRIGKLIEFVKGINSDGYPDGYRWCRVELDSPIMFNGSKYTIGYCREDVLSNVE